MNEDLSRLLSSRKSVEEHKPLFFNLAKDEDKQSMQALLTENADIKVIDTYDTQLEELFVLQNPWLHLDPERRKKEYKEHRREHFRGKEAWQAGLWIYLPWRQVLLHVLEDNGYQEVRTGRNRNLIPPKEQKKFYNSCVGVAGQSVGNSCALAIVQTGGGKHMRIADPDTLELTNLNRIRGSIAEITNYKVHMTAHQIYELDPYAELELFTDGITEENIVKFFDSPPKLDVVVDEMDHLGMKIRLRQEAKKRGIPLVTAVDNGDSGLLDVERYDLDPDLVFFNGRAGDDIAERVLNKDLPLPVIGKIIGEELVGYDIVEERMQQSLLEIGKTIPTWPQLGTAAWVNGVLVAVAVRRIVTGLPIISDRAVISIPSVMEPGYTDSEAKEERSRKTAEFARKYDEAIESFLKNRPR